jgi:hypothetical protein
MKMPLSLSLLAIEKGQSVRPDVMICADWAVGSCLPSHCQALAMPQPDLPVTSLCICPACECMLPLYDLLLISYSQFSVNELLP